jgi:hypothetical protein
MPRLTDETVLAVGRLAAISIVRWDSDQPPSLVSFNDTGHLS